MPLWMQIIHANSEYDVHPARLRKRDNYSSSVFIYPLDPMEGLALWKEALQLKGLERICCPRLIRNYDSSAPGIETTLKMAQLLAYWWMAVLANLYWRIDLVNV